MFGVVPLGLTRKKCNMGKLTLVLIGQTLNILYLLISISFILAGGGLFACIWAIKNGQYSDVESAAQKLVFDEPDK